jgi:hypothetical protein
MPHFSAPKAFGNTGDVGSPDMIRLCDLKATKKIRILDPIIHLSKSNALSRRQ